MSTGTAKKNALKTAEALSAEAKAATDAADKIDHKYTLLEKHAQAAQQKAKKASDAADAAAKNAQEKAQAAAQALVASVQTEVDDLTSEISDMQSTFASDIRGSDDIQSIWEELLGEGTATTSNLQGRLDEVQASVERFADDLKKLAGMGASSDLLEQIAGMGPDEGDMLAQQLISAGTGSISQLNGTLSTIDSYVQSTADDLTKNFYGAGVNALAQFIQGLESQFPELKKALQAVLDELEGSLEPTATTAKTVATATKALSGTGIVASTTAAKSTTKVGGGAFGAAGALIESGGSTKITTINMGPTYNPAPEPTTVTVARRLRTLAAIGPW
jgi:chromosome segregation ATPase